MNKEKYSFVRMCENLLRPTIAMILITFFLNLAAIGLAAVSVQPFTIFVALGATAAFLLSLLMMLLLIAVHYTSVFFRKLYTLGVQGEQ